jgi:hypothetical protein
MTRDREIAQAISEGINCIAAIVVALRADASAPKEPNLEWETSLHEMERALDSILAKEVWTSMEVGEEDRDRIRKLCELISGWVKTQVVPGELRVEAESILRFYGISLDQPTPLR